MKMATQCLKLVVLYILLVLIGFSCSGQDQKSAHQKEFEEYLNQICKDYNIPAIAAAVIRTDKIEKIAAVGVKKMGDNNEVDIQNKFHIGSCGKSFTGILAQKLVNDEIISWDEKPVGVFPELGEVIHEDFEDITFLDLMTNRAGIPGYSYWHEKEQIPEMVKNAVCIMGAKQHFLQ